MKWIYFTIGLLLWCSCQTSRPQPDNSNIDPTDSLYLEEQKLKKLEVGFQSSISIRNSDYIIYPIGTNAEVEAKYTKLHFYGLGGRYGKRYKNEYLNLLFHNLQTGENHLLFPDTLAILKSYQIMGNTERNNIGQTTSLPEKIALDRKKFIFYEIVRDLNADGKIDDKDPKRLYTSNLDGKNLTLVSPHNMHLLDWKFPKHNQNTIELVLLEDYNQSGIFNRKTDREVFIKTHLDSIGQFETIMDWKLIKEIKSKYLYLNKKD